MKKRETIMDRLYLEGKYADMKKLRKFLMLFMLCTVVAACFGKETALAAAKSFTVEYDAGGGTGSMKSTKVTYGKSTALRSNQFKRTGYTFSGWNAYRASDKKWRTKEAGWQTEKNIEKNGYTRTVYKDGASVSKTTSVDKDTVTMYAVWKANTFTVEYDAGGGTGSMKSTKVTYGTDTALRKNQFKLTGYTFSGWNACRASDNKWRTKENGWQTRKNIEKNGYALFVYKNGASIAKTTSVNKDTITMSAVWKVNTFTVEYNANGGKGSMESTKVTYGKSTKLRANQFKRTGYTFSGWNAYRASDNKWRTEENGWQTQSTIDANGYTLTVYKNKVSIAKTTSVNKDTITMYAVWKNNEYTVSYHANGGKGTMESTRVIYGEDIRLSSNEFTRSGYGFDGWNAYRESDQKWRTEENGWQTEETIEANGYGLYVYQNEASISQTTSVNGDVVDMYAVWLERSMISINHRGYGDAPENTLSAFRLSKRKGFTYVEADVSFTSDHVPVLLHDSTVDRTSNGTGKISQMTFEQVRKLDFGSWKSSEYEGEQIPSFEEFIKLCRQLRLHAYVEIKDSDICTEEDIKAMVDLVDSYRMSRSVTWISFSSEYLAYIRDYDSSAQLGYVVNKVSETVIDTAVSLETGFNEVFINASYSKLTNSGIKLCRENHLFLEVWTVDNEEAIRTMHPYVTGITSNYLNANDILGL